MKNNAMDLVFILDKSGSMASLESDTIGGSNSILKKQHQRNTSAKVTTVLFDNNYTLIHDRFEIDQIRPRKVSRKTVSENFRVQGTA